MDSELLLIFLSKLPIIKEKKFLPLHDLVIFKPKNSLNF